YSRGRRKFRRANGATQSSLDRSVSDPSQRRRGAGAASLSKTMPLWADAGAVRGAEVGERGSRCVNGDDGHASAWMPWGAAARTADQVAGKERSRRKAAASSEA